MSPTVVKLFELRRDVLGYDVRITLLAGFVVGQFC
jgi:hypothetical protein